MGYSEAGLSEITMERAAIIVCLLIMAVVMIDCNSELADRYISRHMHEMLSGGPLLLLMNRAEKYVWQGKVLDIETEQKYDAQIMLERPRLASDCKDLVDKLETSVKRSKGRITFEDILEGSDYHPELMVIAACVKFIDGSFGITH